MGKHHTRRRLAIKARQNRDCALCVGVTVASDGALLVSDDGANVIYRISYRQ